MQWTKGRIVAGAILVFLIYLYHLGSQPGHYDPPQLYPTASTGKLPDIRVYRLSGDSSAYQPMYLSDDGLRELIEGTDLQDLACGEPIWIDGPTDSFEIEPANC